MISPTAAAGAGAGGSTDHGHQTARVLAEVFARSRYLPAPPRTMIEHVGGSGATEESFRRIGIVIAHALARHGFFDHQDATIVDLGCGCGRVALGIAHFLPPAGRYLGFDTWPAGIAWAAKHISSRYPNFTFSVVSDGARLDPRSGARRVLARLRSSRLVDMVPATVRSRLRSVAVSTLEHIDPSKDHYEGSQAYALDLPDASVDGIIATSVFTHLEYPAASRYFAELGRVLKDGGRAYITFFLLDERTRPFVDALQGEVSTDESGSYMVEGGYVSSYLYPSAVEDLSSAAGLEVVDVERGSWPAESDGVRPYQDVFVFRRKQR